MNSVTINLNSPTYEQFTYPAGETQVRLKHLAAPSADHVRIIARIKNGEDIVRLALLKSAVDDGQYVDLVLPYLPYSRADRRFKPGDCLGLEVFGSLINSMGFSRVVTLDAHNGKKAVEYIHRLQDRSAMPLIRQAIYHFAKQHKSDRVTVLFPDQGARDRYVLSPALEGNAERITLNVLHCEKKRDPLTGDLKGFEVPPVPSRFPAIIIDDICDGGGTFTGIAAQLLHSGLGLYVTHGIFSKGRELVCSYFDTVYTTNTIDQPEDAPVTVLDAMPILLKDISC